MDIPERRGAEIGGLGPAGIISSVSSEGSPLVLLRLFTCSGNK